MFDGAFAVEPIASTLRDWVLDDISAPPPQQRYADMASDNMSITAPFKHLSKEETLEALCETCRGLLIRPNEDLHGRADTTYYTHRVRAAAKSRCPLRTWFHRFLCQEKISTRDTDKLVFPAVLYEPSAQSSVRRMQTNDKTSDIQERKILLGMVELDMYLYLGPYTSINGQLMMQMDRLHAIDPLNVPVSCSIT